MRDIVVSSDFYTLQIWLNFVNALHENKVDAHATFVVCEFILEIKINTNILVLL